MCMRLLCVQKLHETALEVLRLMSDQELARLRGCSVAFWRLVHLHSSCRFSSTRSVKLMIILSPLVTQAS